mgnify:CR=1 FL=1|jgi:Predicted signal transduction protein with a C-terminal ATPase domain
MHPDNGSKGKFRMNARSTFRKNLYNGFRQRFFTKIRSRLFLTYVAVIVLGICLMGVTSYQVSHDALERKAIEASGQTAAQIIMNLDFRFEEIKRVLIAPYYQTEFINGINRHDAMSEAERIVYQQFLHSFFSKSYYVPRQNSFAGFAVLHSNGELMYHTSEIEPDIMRASYASGNWVGKTVAERGGVYFNGVERDKYSGSDRYIFSASIMIRDLSNNRNVYSVARAHYTLDMFREIFDEYRIDTGSKAVLIDQDGNIVYSTGNDEPGLPLDRALLESAAASNIAWYQGEDEDYLALSARSAVNGWTMILLTPESHIFNASYQILKLTGLFAAVALLITVVVSLWFASSITRPILHLYKLVNSVKRGNLNIRAQIRQDDEIGNIAVNINMMLDEIERLIRNKYVYQLKLRESELALLYSQINPHFLYNTLDSIRSIADFYQIEEIAMMTTSLADMFRYSLTEREFVTVEQELRHVRDYLNIQTLRFGAKIRVELDIDEEVLGERILKITLQPVVENAFRHGLEKKKGGGVLTIRAYADPESIHFIIRDNGVGMSAEQLHRLRRKLSAAHEVEDVLEQPPAEHRTTGVGVGLANVHARLLIHFGGRYRIRIDSEEGKGTEVELVLPRQPERRAAELAMNAGQGG